MSDSPPLLSLIIVYHRQIAEAHADFLIDALNRQTSLAFNSFWIDQTSGAGAASQGASLGDSLAAAARFEWELVETAHPLVDGLSCWELTGPFARLMEHPAIGRWFCYLHLECLPESDFAQSLLALLPEIETQYGRRTICMLRQLWSELSVSDLHPRLYLEQLRLSDLRHWYRKTPFAGRPGLASYESGWEEDAFAMPTALARELQLYASVEAPLYFQDLFDIFHWLPRRAYAADLRWVRIETALIYHLFHARPFREFDAPFMAAVRAHPELFGHLAIFEMANEGLAYREPLALREQNYVAPDLIDFYNRLRWSERGTMGHWIQALDKAHGWEP